MSRLALRSAVIRDCRERGLDVLSSAKHLFVLELVKSAGEAARLLRDEGWADWDDARTMPFSQIRVGWVCSCRGQLLGTLRAIVHDDDGQIHSVSGCFI